MSYIRKFKHIFTRFSYESGRSKQVAYYKNQEFISLLAYICADRTALLPILIYKSESGDVLDTWI
jgi:hypothetical protein